MGRHVSNSLADAFQTLLEVVPEASQILSRCQPKSPRCFPEPAWRHPWSFPSGDWFHHRLPAVRDSLAPRDPKRPRADLNRDRWIQSPEC